MIYLVYNLWITMHSILECLSMSTQSPNRCTQAFKGVTTVPLGSVTFQPVHYARLGHAVPPCRDSWSQAVGSMGTSTATPETVAPGKPRELAPERLRAVFPQHYNVVLVNSIQSRPDSVFLATELIRMISIC